MQRVENGQNAKYENGQNAKVVQTQNCENGQNTNMWKRSKPKKVKMQRF